MSTPAKHAACTPGPWQYVPSTEHHGPYVTSDFGSTICDCYVMSQPGFLSTLNGGESKPVPFLHEMADPNARLIATAPELLAALEAVCSEFAQGHPLILAGRAAIAKALASPVLEREG